MGNTIISHITSTLSYYFDHREEIDKSITEGEAFAAALPSRVPSKLLERLRGQRYSGFR